MRLLSHVSYRTCCVVRIFEAPPNILHIFILPNLVRCDTKQQDEQFGFAPRSGGTQGHCKFTSVCDRQTAWMTVLAPRNAHFVVIWCSEKWKLVSSVVARVLGTHRMVGRLEGCVLSAFLALGSSKEVEGRKEDMCCLDFESGHCPISSHRYTHRDT